MANSSDIVGDPQGMMFPQGPDIPLRELPMTINPEETQTGRLMFGVGVNSDAGLVGNVTIDEQNFDWRAVPESWEDVLGGPRLPRRRRALPPGARARHPGAART